MRSLNLGLNSLRLGLNRLGQKRITYLGLLPMAATELYWNLGVCLGTSPIYAMIPDALTLITSLAKEPTSTFYGKTVL